VAEKRTQAQIAEIVRCGKDPSYFIKTYVKIQHPTKGLLPFKTFKFQDECVDAFKEHRFNITLKSRQLGLSTVTAAYSVWLAIFYQQKNILVIATKLSTAINFIKKVKTAVDALPPWLLVPQIKSEAKSTIAFSNGSQIVAVPTSQDAGRSEALSLLIVDECVGGETLISVKDTFTGEENTLSIRELADKLQATQNVTTVIVERDDKEHIADVVKNTTFQVKSPMGWVDFDGVKKSARKNVYELQFSNNETLVTTPEHKLKNSVGDFVYVRDLQVGSLLCNEVTVKSITFKDEETEVFDLINVDKGHEYYTNNIVSSNCAFIRGFGELWTGLYPTLSCLTKETRVLAKDGFHKIVDMCRDNSGGYKEATPDVEVYARHGFEPVSHTYVTTPRPIKKIITRSGRVIRATHEHPLWTLSNLAPEMKEVSSLKIGDCLKVSFGMNVYDAQPFDVEEAYRLGVYSAEGWIPRQNKNDDAPRYSIFISNSDEEIRNKFLSVGFKVLQGIKLAIFSHAAVKRYESYGINPKQKCDTKEVPEVIWRGNAEVQKAYLQGYFDGDGCASNGVCASSASEQLIQGVQLLLLNMGICARVRFCKANPERAGVGTRVMPSGQTLTSVRDQWALTIPRTQLRLFEKRVGFSLKRKQDSLREQITKYNLPSIQSSRLQELPNNVAKQVIDLFRLLKVRSGLPYSTLRNVEKLRFEKNPTQRTTLKLLNNETLGQYLTNDERNWLTEICGDDNSYWDDIVSIEDDVDQVTYDFTVPGSHTFLQNSILGSNCGGNAIIISTPNGMTGLGKQFYKMWVEAEAGLSEFNAIRLPWTVHPERNQAWFDKEAKNLGDPQRIAQELLCDFQGSSETYIKNDDLIELRSRLQDPIEKNGLVWIWKHPDPSKKYVVSADVARGDSTDFSAFHVFDYDTCEQVAEYMGKTPPDRFGELLLEWGKKYNEAVIAPENNTFGYMTCMRIKVEGYKRLYHSKMKGDPFLAVPEDDDVAGFNTNSKTRPQILSRLEEVIRNKQCRFYSRRTYEQLHTFIWNNGKAAATTDSNDDLVMSAAIGIWVCAGGDKILTANSSLTIALLDNMTLVKNERHPAFADIDSVTQPPSNITTSTQPVRSPYGNTYGRKVGAQDFSWLLR
jgi:intein/homing endonuclease